MPCIYVCELSRCVLAVKRTFALNRTNVLACYALVEHNWKVYLASWALLKIHPRIITVFTTIYMHTLPLKAMEYQSISFPCSKHVFFRCLIRSQNLNKKISHNKIHWWLKTLDYLFSESRHPANLIQLLCGLETLGEIRIFRIRVRATKLNVGEKVNIVIFAKGHISARVKLTPRSKTSWLRVKKMMKFPCKIWRTRNTFFRYLFCK